MILVVAVFDCETEASPERAFVFGGLVVAVESDGGGVVVEFVEIW